MGLLGIYIAVYQGTVSNIMADYNIDTGIMGVLIALHFAGSIVMPVIFGEIGDRKGEKVSLACGFLSLLIGLALIVNRSSILIFAAGIFIIGGGFAVVEGVLSGILIQLNPDRRESAVNLSQTFFCLGAAFGPFLIEIVKTQGMSWRAIYIALGAAFFLCFLLFMAVNIPTNRQPKIPGLRIRRILRNRTVILLLLCIFIYVGVEEGTAFWISSYITFVHPDVGSGLIFITLYWLGMGAGRFIYSLLKKPSPVIGMIWLIPSLIFLVMMLVTRELIWQYICIFCIGFGFAPVWSWLMVSASNEQEESRNTALGAMMSMGAVGGLLMPAALGMAANAVGMEITFWGLPLFLFFLALLLILKNAGRRTRPG